MEGAEYIDVTIQIESDESLKFGASEVLRRIRPTWEAESITWKSFSEGITNKLIGAWCGDKSDTVLIRVYGLGTEVIIDRKEEVENMEKLNKMGIGSKLYAIFNNGIAYEFIHGSILTQKMVKDPAVYKLVACMMARLHTIETETEEVGLWKRLLKFINLTPTSLENKGDQIRLEKEYFTREQLLAEYHMLKDMLENSRSPVVFCHNDALLANIVVQSDRVVFIDMEYGGPAPAAYDIANHFVEFVGCDGKLDYVKWYPDKDLQMDWISTYLSNYSSFTGTASPTTKEIEAMYELVQKFTLCAHLLWSAWALFQAKNSDIDFDYVDYAIQRLDEYKRMKGLLGL